MATLHPDLYAAAYNYSLSVEHANKLAAEYHAALLTVVRRATEVANILHKVECPHSDIKAREESVDKHYGTSSTDRAWCNRCGWYGRVYQLTQEHSGPVCPKCGAYVRDIDYHVIRVPPEQVKYPCESKPGFPPQATKS